MSIDSHDALAMRREIYADGKVSKTDLERLIAKARGEKGETSQAFTELISDVALDLMLNDVDPPKYIQRAQAEWLIALLSKDGGLANKAEYDTLIRLIRNAVSMPPALASFAVSEIERAIMTRRSIAAEDLEALRTVVFAAAEGSALHVNRDSAEALFRIADAMAETSDDAFDDFFAKAIGNYLMGVAFRWTPSADEARKADDWLDEPAPRFGAFIGAMFDFDRIREADEDVIKRRNDAVETALGQAAPIDVAEADWLLLRLHRDGKISRAEQRLLSFLKQEATVVAPALAALMNKAA
ncbi:hypothetical protein [Methylocystis parvus]|uniref:hypothetical protein n=1 Tax=Methylocystis parvus TaxID=134 RepID=UPI003C7094A8